MSLFDFAYTNNQSNAKNDPKEISATNDPASNNSGEKIGYYFYDLKEFLLYCQLCKGKDNSEKIYWLEGRDFVNAYNSAYQLFEEGKLEEALQSYQNSLKLNPIGICSRFEICEILIKLKRFDEAKHTLFDMKDFMVVNEDIAKFYRRLGFIEIELKNYECAVACYAFSVTAEDNSSVAQELLYIQQIGHISTRKIEATIRNLVTVLQQNNIPLLKEDKAYKS